MEPSATLSRRAFLQFCLAIPVPLVLAACGGQATGTFTPIQSAATQPPTRVPPTQAPAVTEAAPTAAPQVLAPTPACGDDDDDPTPSQTEGPFYTPSTPERTSLLESGMVGARLKLTGVVLGTNCQPIANALLDFWHADDAGVYDNEGFRLRGHQFADEAGRYTLETIVPGLYPGRTRHIHVKVQAPNQPILTTQLYFPGEPRNDSDSIFHPDLLMAVEDAADGKAATFNFVLNV